MPYKLYTEYAGFHWPFIAPPSDVALASPREAGAPPHLCLENAS